jgi:hypothetical protein
MANTIDAVERLAAAPLFALVLIVVVLMSLSSVRNLEIGQDRVNSQSEPRVEPANSECMTERRLSAHLG